MTAVLDLHGARTGNCLRVTIALEELGLAWRPVRVDLSQAEQRSAEHLALNPLGKVPVLVEHGDSGATTLITQSNAILLHLAAARPGMLLPLAPAHAVTHVLERFLFFVTDVIAVSHQAFWLRNHEGDANSLRILNERALGNLHEAERYVRRSPFMAGDTFTLADIAGLTIAQSYEQDLPWERLPHLKRWFDACMARPAVERGLHAFD